jgi:hypothetical protein
MFEFGPQHISGLVCVRSALSFLLVGVDPGNCLESNRGSQADAEGGRGGLLSLAGVAAHLRLRRQKAAVDPRLGDTWRVEGPTSQPRDSGDGQSLGLGGDPADAYERRGWG